MADTTQTLSTPRSGGADTTPTASSVVHQAEDQARRALAETRELGAEVMSAVRETATSFFEEQRDRAATEITAVSKLLRSSVQQLDRNGGTVGDYADDAARQIASFADRLRTRSWNQLCGDLEGFARSNPMMFIAAAMGAGFVGARLLAASARQPVGLTPIQSSMAMLRDTGEQLRSVLRDERADAGAPPAGSRSTTAGATSGTPRFGSNTTSGAGSANISGSMSGGFGSGTTGPR